MVVKSKKFKVKRGLSPPAYYMRGQAMREDYKEPPSYLPPEGEGDTRLRGNDNF